MSRKQRAAYEITIDHCPYECVFDRTDKKRQKFRILGASNVFPLLKERDQCRFPEKYVGMTVENRLGDEIFVWVDHLGDELVLTYKNYSPKGVDVENAIRKLLFGGADAIGYEILERYD
ncbi:MAG: hypothetical protein WBB28_01770 [Crinalium sp.]